MEQNPRVAGDCDEGVLEEDTSKIESITETDASAAATTLGSDTKQSIASALRECLEDLAQEAGLKEGSLVVVGASTSEVLGRRIGTATSVDLGQVLVDEVLAFFTSLGCDVAFQCCEHLNRSLVLSRSVAESRGYNQVFAIPVPGAGGAVASCAYFALPDACLVSQVSADAGIDIGDTLIGMHLRRVAVPVRGRRNQIGNAHVTMARSRPPLVGGSRAVYDEQTARARLLRR